MLHFTIPPAGMLASKFIGCLCISIPIQDAAFDEIKECVASESNKTTKGVELKVSVPVITVPESLAYFLLITYTLPT